MKITNMTLYKVPPRWLFLKVETDEGITGWGEPVVEGRADTVRTAVEEFKPYLLGKDPMQIEDHWQAMYRGGPEVMSAISGIDQALWDIKGKYYQAPVYDLLGRDAVYRRNALLFIHLSHSYCGPRGRRRFLWRRTDLRAAGGKETAGRDPIRGSGLVLKTQHRA